MSHKADLVAEVRFAFDEVVKRLKNLSGIVGLYVADAELDERVECVVSEKIAVNLREELGKDLRLDFAGFVDFQL